MSYLLETDPKRCISNKFLNKTKHVCYTCSRHLSKNIKQKGYCTAIAQVFVKTFLDFSSRFACQVSHACVVCSRRSVPDWKRRRLSRASFGGAPGGQQPWFCELPVMVLVLLSLYLIKRPIIYVSFVLGFVIKQIQENQSILIGQRGSFSGVMVRGHAVLSCLFRRLKLGVHHSFGYGSKRCHPWGPQVLFRFFFLLPIIGFFRYTVFIQNHLFYL